ncbi:unnamed protein product, partial [Rotaria sp. Silwood2]
MWSRLPVHSIGVCGDGMVSKDPGPGLPPVEATGEWKHAGNAYYYFDENVSGI